MAEPVVDSPADQLPIVHLQELEQRIGAEERASDLGSKSSKWGKWPDQDQGVIYGAVLDAAHLRAVVSEWFYGLCFEGGILEAGGWRDHTSTKLT